MDKSHKYSIREHIALTFFFVFISCMIWYHNPVKETISCNKNYKCKIEHYYTDNFKLTNDIRLNSDCVFEEAMSGGAGYQERHIIYNTVRKKQQMFFRKGICSFKEGNVNAYNECRKNIDASLISLKDYIKNPEKGITLNGNGGINYMRKYLVLILFFFTAGMLHPAPVSFIRQLCKKIFRMFVQQMNDEIEDREYYGINTRNL